MLFSCVTHFVTRSDPGKTKRAAPLTGIYPVGGAALFYSDRPAVAPAGCREELPHCGCSLLLILQALILSIRLDGFLGKAVVLPPADQGGHGGDAGGHDLLQLGGLDGQDGLAAGAQDLVGQGQQQTGSAGNGASGDGGGVALVDVCVHNVSSFLQ